MKRMIVKVQDDGLFLELFDKTRWAVNPREKDISCSWVAAQQVTVSGKIKGRSFGFKIENAETGQSVYAFKMR